MKQHSNDTGTSTQVTVDAKFLSDANHRVMSRIDHYELWSVVRLLLAQCH